MPIQTHTLTGNFDALVGEVSTIRATVQTNSADIGWVNDTDNKVVLGGALLTLDSGGAFSIVLPTSTGTGLQYQVTAEFVDADRVRKSWTSGWFSLTGPADLADVANDSTLRVNTTLGDQLAARIDGYTDHGSLSGVLTIDPAVGTHVLDATGALLLTLDTAPDGRIVTLLVASGAENVTVDGIDDLELTDGAFASFVHIRGAWVLASAGGGSTATPDTTPPSAVTDLVATGSEGTLTLAWSAATDAESTVKYGWKVWLTADTEPTTYTIRTTPGVTINDLPAGNYTAKVYSFSNGGSTTADTATATVTTPPGWSTILADTFTGANGTLVGHIPDTSPNNDAWSVGPHWSAGNGDPLHIVSNKVAQDAATTNPACNLQLPAGTRSGIGIGIDYTFTQQPDSGLPQLILGFGPSVKMQMEAGGVTIAADNPSIGGMVLTGTLTGHPLTGRFSYRCTGTALSISINGTEVATATMAQSWNNTTDVTMYAQALKTSTLDNLTVEVLT